MSATIIPGSIFTAHAHKLRSMRLEKLAQSIRRPAASPTAPKPAAVAKRPEPRPSFLGPLSSLRGRGR